jgi:hypothetical protein
MSIASRVIVKFPANVVATGGIVLTISNGIYTFSLGAAEPTIVTADASVAADASAIAIVRNNPAQTILQLPDLTLFSRPTLAIIDWSSNVVNHEVVLTPFGAQTIMRLLTWSMFSNAAQLGSLMLNKSTTLNGWYIA